MLVTHIKRQKKFGYDSYQMIFITT